MAFTPSENPITNPTRESYTELRPFRFWCQKVLPLVYDDSLSYYELLCKVVDYLNKTMEDVDHMNTDMDTLYSNFQEFQEGTFKIYNELVAYVNTYFDELDVQEEIDNKLDEMVKSGELVTILQPSIANEVSSWLSEHITPTSPAIDDTLTVSGAGADAKVTGDNFKKAILNQNSFQYTDANDITENSILFNSVVHGQTVLSNTPNYAGWIQTIMTGGIAVQVYYPYESNLYTRPISIRQKTFSDWGNWSDLSYRQMTQNKLQTISTGDLNNYVENCFLFVSNPNTVQNLPESGAGVLTVMNFDTVVYQSFTNFVSKNTYVRFRLSNTWENWSVLNHTYIESYLEKIVIDITNNHSYTNANDINENSILFNSVVQGQTVLSNTPNYAGWLQTNVLGDFAVQLYYPYESNLYTRPISIRQKTLSGWGNWSDLSYRQMTQNKLESISTGDLNNYVENCFLFVSDPNTVQNLPQSGAGVLTVMNFDSIVFQTFTSYRSKIQLTRFKFFDAWSDWTSGNIIDFKDSFNYRNANDINVSCVLFNSFSAGATVVSNTPNYAGWLQTYYANSNIIIQVYYPIETNKNIKFRTKLFSNWSDWIDIGNSVTKNITENTISNTYNITTSPTITTDTNGWLLPIDSETEDETNKTDMSGAIMSMLNSTGYCHLAKGIYYVSGSIDMPSGSTLIGCGKDTKIKLLNSVTNGYAVRLHTNSTIKDLCISGSYSDIDITNETIGGRSGVYYVGNSDGNDTGITPATTSGCVIENCRIERFNGYGVYGHNTGGNIKNGIIINACHVYDCSVGVCFGYRCEYNKLANSIVSNCYISVTNNGGNNAFENCTIHGIIGMLMDNSTDDMPNNSHGSCNNCIFNHIGSDIDATGNGIEAIKMSNGFVFNDCQFWYSKISLVDCAGFCFNGCLFGASGVISATVKPLFLSSSIFMSAPVMSVPSSSKINNCYTSSGGNVTN